MTREAMQWQQEPTDLLERYYPELVRRLLGLSSELGVLAAIVRDPTEYANFEAIVAQECGAFIDIVFRKIAAANTVTLDDADQSARYLANRLAQLFTLGVWLGQLGLATVPDAPRGDARPRVKRTPMRWPESGGA